MTSEQQALLTTWRVRGPAGSATIERAGPGPLTGSAPSVVPGGPGTLRVACAAPTRGILVSAVGGGVLGMADGADAWVAAEPGASLEVVCSDGVGGRSFVVEVP